MRSIAKILPAVLVAVGIGIGAEELFGGGPATPAVGAVVVSAPLVPFRYSLAFSNGLVVAEGGYGNGCLDSLLDPTNLRLVRTASCNRNFSSPANGPIVEKYTHQGVAIQIATSGAGRASRLGPVVLNTNGWDWAHSQAVVGARGIWIFDMRRSQLLEVSPATGRIERQFGSVDAGADAYLSVDDDGVWLTSSTWDGSFCATTCPLWHFDSTTNRLVMARRLGVGTQWFVASGHNLYADVLSRVPGGFRQSIWLLNGSDAKVERRVPATLLPADEFGGTGYGVLGNSEFGLFTVSALGDRTTPTQIGACNATAPLRVVRIDPLTLAQSYLATLPRTVSGGTNQCFLWGQPQAALSGGALYFLGSQEGPGPEYARVVRVEV